MQDQTHVTNPDANPAGLKPDADLENALLPGQDAGQGTATPAQSGGGGGGNPPAGNNSNALTTVWRELSPVLAPIPFAIVIFLFSLLANAHGIDYVAPLPLGIVLLALVVIQGTCLFYAGNNETLWVLSIAGGYLLFVLVGAYVFFGLGGSILLLIILVVLALIFGGRIIRQVPVGYVDVIVTPRGQSRTLTPGFHLLFPWDKVQAHLSTKEIIWTSPPVHFTISRDQEVDIVTDVTYQLAEDDADIAVLHMANWEEELRRQFLGILKSVVNELPPGDLVSWAHHVHDRQQAVDDLANPAAETRWDRLNTALLWRLQSQMANRGIQVNLVQVQDITVLSHFPSSSAQTRPVETGAVRGQQAQQAPTPSPPPFSLPPQPPQPPTQPFTAPPPPTAQAQQAQAAQFPRVVLPSQTQNSNLSIPPSQGVIQGMIDSYQAVNNQFINDPNFIMDLAARFKAIANNPEANAHFPVDAEKASCNLIQRANYILASEERRHHGSQPPPPAPVQHYVYHVPTPPNENLTKGG